VFILPISAPLAGAQDRELVRLAFIIQPTPADRVVVSAAT